MSASIRSVSRRLCDLSRERFIDPYSRIRWPESVDPDGWYFSPRLLSIHGTAVAGMLGEAGMRRLSLLEALNFFSLNIHGEKQLLQGIAARLHEERFRDASPYLQHFIDEENKHLFWFGEFCRRYGRIYPSRLVTLAAETLPTDVEDFLFFARIMMFEDIVDTYNAQMAADEALVPVAREINRLHHADEVRHRAFGRSLLRHLWREGSTRWSRSTRERVSDSLRLYPGVAWREYFNPDVYRDAGLADPHAVMRTAWASEEAVRRRQEMTAPSIRFLVGLGAIREEQG
jgi:hypothetical protein